MITQLSTASAKQKELWQLGKFILVGALCAGVDLLLFVLLSDYFRVDYLVANPFSTFLAILLNYFLSKKWVFKSGKYSSRVELVAFVLFSVAGFFLNQCLLWLFVEQVLLDPTYSKVLAIILVAVFNFITKKLFVFKG
ncbi:GtrA family protein [Rufibacter psychrotolerans]|uniref:GtrA family protein n=1 Tax=Rufibacter psychrotolerans TaxID=2812556 RepID=UPI0019677289|nr:GtrA family protein [Rufibacter sp. SYSU D00308]